MLWTHVVNKNTDITLFDIIMIEQIENTFSRATQLSFSEAPFPNDPQWHDRVILGFSTAGEADDDYRLLVRTFSNHECTLVIYRQDQFIDLTVVNDFTKDFFNVKSLKYDAEEFNRFEKHVTHSKGFEFLVGCGHVSTLNGREKTLWIKKRVVKI